jgi:hypothetical protein
MPAPTAVVSPSTSSGRTEPAVRDDEDAAAREQAEQFVLKITQHRLAGRSALLVGDLDTAFQELWTARDLEPSLDHLGAVARAVVPRDWEHETDLTPLARALSAKGHPRTAETWRRILEDRPARSIQAEASEWLAHHAFGLGQPRAALRLLHATTTLGRHIETEVFVSAYKLAGIDIEAAFSLYLAAARLDLHTARANGLRDPLTDHSWCDQDARWWLDQSSTTAPYDRSDHQLEALNRARDLARARRDEGWLRLAEGDYLAGPLGVRTLGRNVRAGCAEAADHDTFLRIRMAYETAADRLPDVAWPWYRLAELLAWAGFAEQAQEHLRQAERRSLGGPDKEQRRMLRMLVDAGLGSVTEGLATAARPFPSQPFNAPLLARLRFR